MRLISVYITGYGKFVNESFEFTEGLNVFVKENGWGKSTLSAFIKAMFFGMNVSKARELNDRRHYMPWSKGQYGGNLVFEIDGKTYRIERFFGKKESEDEFKLIDCDTEKESDDYSSNIGEEIFEVDRDSFEKSVFVPQNALGTGMTDRINGKMGDLATVRDDITNFDSAIKRIDDEIAIYKKNSKTDKRGKILLINDQIKALNEDVERLPAYEESAKGFSDLLEEQDKAYKELEQKRDELKDKILKQSDKEKSLGEYKSKQESLQGLKKDLDELDDFFVNGIPELEEVDEYQEMDRALELCRKELDTMNEKMPPQEKVDELKTLFEKPLEDDQIEGWKEKANRLKELRIQKEHASMSDEEKDALQELKYYFAKKVPTDEELELIQKEAENVSLLEGRLHELRDVYKQQKKTCDEAKLEQKDGPESGRAQKLLMILVSLILLFGGIALVAFVPTMAGRITGVICMAIAALVLVFAFVIKAKRSKGHKLLLKELERNAKEALEKYEHVKTKYEASANICNTFLSDFLVNANDTKLQMIMDIKLKLNKYKTLIENEGRAIEAGGNAVEELTQLEVELYTELLHFQNVYKVEDLYTSNSEEELLAMLEEDNKLFKLYYESDNARQELIETQDRLIKTLTSFINRFPSLEQETIFEKLAEIRRRIESFYDLQKRVNENEDAIKIIAEKFDISENTVSIDLLQKEQDEVGQEIIELTEAINMTRTQLADARESISDCDDKADTIEKLVEERSEYETNVAYLEDTKKYLTRAKEKFLATYMGPLRNGMRDYLSRIDVTDEGPIADKFKIDTSLAVSYNYEGATKSSDYFSAGYQDMAALCARFALIDIMYEKNKPMMVLDDPFTNLDKKKAEMALNLIKDLSKENQIIYFTCHESRA